MSTALADLDAQPPPDPPSLRWHVGPGTDLSAYAFSWAFVLAPLTLLTEPYQRATLFLVVVGLTFAHRHYTLPYVYMDREIFDRHPRRFTLFPAVMALGFVATPFLWNTAARPLVAGVVFLAGVWNIWHVYAQKFGILRLYAAKSGSDVEIPRWVDRLLLFAWVPLYVAWLGPEYRAQVFFAFPTVKDITLPLIDALMKAQPYLLAPAWLIVAASLGLFARHEWRSTRFRNAPRLGMAVGTTLLSASFLVFNPVHVFMAFAFSHAVEYMVFVWAFQRRRYSRTLPHEPLLGRVLGRPWLAYGAFTALLVFPYLLIRFYGAIIVPEASSPSPTRHDDRTLGVLLERVAVAGALLLRRVLVEDADAGGTGQHLM